MVKNIEESSSGQNAFPIMFPIHAVPRPRISEVTCTLLNALFASLKNTDLTCSQKQ